MQQMLKGRSNKVFGYVFQDGRIMEGAIITTPPFNNTITVTIASPAVVTWTAHGKTAGSPVVFETTGALPTGLTAGVVYYVIADGLTTNAFEVSATSGGSAINTSGSQSGTHSAVTNTVVISDGTIFIGGAAYDVTGEGLPIPMNQRVQVGIRIQTVAISEIDDPTLNNPALMMEGFGVGGAGREVAQLRWGYAADDGTRDSYTGWNFYPVFIVDKGTPILKANPLVANPVQALLANYDNNANGNYIGQGFNVTYVGTDGSSNYVYDVQSGVANILGYEVARQADTMLHIAPDPDTRAVVNENHTFTPDINGDFTMFTNFGPISAVTEIIGETQAVAEVVTRGGVSGTADTLAHTGSLVGVQTVNQGGTVYLLGTDFVITSGTIDWSPSGAEPAPSSTYTVTYTYLMTPVPTSQGSNFLVFHGLYAGSTIIFSYSWKVPRVDAIILNADGTLAKVNGIAQPVQPVAPLPTETQLLLATVTMDWITDPVVASVGIRAIQMWEHNLLRTQTWNLFQLVADLQLKFDVSAAAPSSTLGIFTDPLMDSNQRDLGQTQNAAIVAQELVLPITGAVTLTGSNATNENLGWTLDFTTEVVAQQLDHTACLAINPYQVFNPLPAKVVLVPQIDHYIDVIDNIVSTVTNFAGTRTQDWRPGLPLYIVTQSSVSQSVLSDKAVVQQYMRSQRVQFTISGFLAGEGLAAAKFNGVDVSSTVLPALPQVADSHGGFTGTFLIPTSTPAGVRLFEALGSGGSYGSQNYIGDFTIDTRNIAQTITTWNLLADPLAQTFTLTEDRMVSSIDIRVCAIGNTANQIRMQIRGTTVGIPNGTIYAQCYKAGTDLVLNDWNTFTFDIPVWVKGNQEYCIVLLTDDATHAVSVARLGDIQTTGPGSPKFITENPYTVGVLLASSNASTWLPLEGQDLTFRINACIFSPTSKTVAYGTVSVSTLTDFMFAANVVRPSVACDVSFEADEVSTPSAVHNTPENSLLALPYSLTDSMTLKANMVGASKLSPIIYPNPQIFGGTMQNTATYISRTIPANANFALTVIIETYTPGASSVVPTIAVADIISMVEQQDGGGVYLRSYAAMTLSARAAVGDGWYQDTWTITGAKGVDPAVRYTALKLTLTGTPQSRPACRKIRVFNVAL